MDSSRRQLLTSVTAVALAGCMTSDNQTDSRETSASTASDNKTLVSNIHGVEINTKDYNLNVLPFHDRPQNVYLYTMPEHDNERCRLETWSEEGLKDHFDPLPTRKVDGEEGHHPLRTAKWSMWLIQCHHNTGEWRYLDVAKQAARDYVDIADKHDGALYFPYEFTWTRPTGETFEPPWYSAKAQGVSLSLFVNLHKITQSKEFRMYAEKVFQSYLNFKRKTEGPWISLVDEDGYYWTEEYPYDPPSHVLNGKNTAIWGLYDYWLTFRTDESERLLRAAISSIEDHLDDWRNTGDVSNYDLSGEIQLPNYHDVHIRQLEWMYSITSKNVFAEYAQKLKDDYEV